MSSTQLQTNYSQSNRTFLRLAPVAFQISPFWHIHFIGSSWQYSLIWTTPSLHMTLFSTILFKDSFREHVQVKYILNLCRIVMNTFIILRYFTNLEKQRSGKRNYIWRKNAFNKTCSISYLRTWYISSKYWWNNLNLSCYLLCCQFLLLREFFAAFDLQSSVTSSLITTASTELNLVTWTIALITEIACTFPVNIPIIRIVQSYEKSFCLHFIFFFNFRNFPRLLRPHQKHCLLK